MAFNIKPEIAKLNRKAVDKLVGNGPDPGHEMSDVQLALNRPPVYSSLFSGDVIDLVDESTVSPAYWRMLRWQAKSKAVKLDTVYPSAYGGIQELAGHWLDGSLMYRQVVYNGIEPTEHAKQAECLRQQPLPASPVVEPMPRFYMWPSRIPVW